MEDRIIEGIVIGATGGALAGITVYLIQYLHSKVLRHVESSRIYDWLEENTQRDTFRSTRAIASWTNLPMERVQYLCSHDKRIKLSTGQNEDLWALRKNVTETIYE